jgi:hypothetical protein
MGVREKDLSTERTEITERRGGGIQPKVGDGGKRGDGRGFGD